MSGGMGRNGFFAAFFFCLIIADVSGAFFKLRKIASSAPNDNSTKIGISPLPSDATGGKESKPLPVNATDKPSKEKNNDTQVPNNSSKVDPKGSTGMGFVSSPIGKQKGNEKNYQGTEKNDDKTHTEAKTVGNCDGLSKCTDQNKMIACVRSYGKGFKEVVLLVQNEGGTTLKVNLTVPTSAENGFKDKKIREHHTEMIKVPLIIVERTKLILNAGHGECVLHIGLPVSKRTFKIQFPSYSKVATPIYGACFLFLTLVIAGGSWACCKFRKGKRQLDGVPYQELEMGLPEAGSAVDVETAQGWDEGWDDDWDGDNAVKSPGGHHVGSISGNGLTSRAVNRDGWEKDWDD